jgi:flagella basal body P-ring formation protein FlgA
MARSTHDVPQQACRIVARRTAALWLVCAVAGAGWAPVALAQQAGAPIVIPGPGEQNPADLARMTALATSASSNHTVRTTNPSLAATLAPTALATAPVSDRFSALANAGGAIVIPGSGEAAAPGMVSTPQGNAASNTGLTRVNLSPALAASQVVPVIVTSAPPRNYAAYATSARPVNAAPAVPAATPASDVEIDSLASRGEPPELGASASAHNPAQRLAVPQIATLAATPNPTQALAQAAQREQAVQALQRAQAAQAAQTPQAAQMAQTSQAAQAAQAAQTAQPAHAPVNPAFNPRLNPTLLPTQTSRTTPASQPVEAAQPVPAGQEDGELIHAAALDFLKQQVDGLPGKVELTVAPAFPRGLAACATLQPFMPNGARLWGRTTVAVRCTSGHPWTVWLQAKVSVHATYYIAARAMLPGEVISEADLVGRDGDLTMLPLSIITAPSQAIGSVTLMRVGAGLPLRQDMLKNTASVTAGTQVRVVAQGDGFSISSEGSALSNATPGQPVRVRTSTGQILMGIVKDSSTVQIQM